MGAYSLKWAHMKTGCSNLSQDSFPTLRKDREQLQKCLVLIVQPWAVLHLCSTLFDSWSELGWAGLSWSGLTGLGPLFAILATTSWKQHRTCNPPLGTGPNIFRSPPTSWFFQVSFERKIFMLCGKLFYLPTFRIDRAHVKKVNLKFSSIFSLNCRDCQFYLYIMGGILPLISWNDNAPGHHKPAYTAPKSTILTLKFSRLIWSKYIFHQKITKPNLKVTRFERLGRPPKT